jgi:DNA-binding Lrp family transcriptional regulator
MLDQFDRALLNLLQKDASLTADALSERVPLSPSAIARRLRRLRAQHWVAQTIALLSPRLIQRRSRAIVLIQLHDNVDTMRCTNMRAGLSAIAEVQFCYQVTGTHDLIAMVDCSDIGAVHDLVDHMLPTGGIVRRHEINFVKRELKFAPFVDLTETDTASGRALFKRAQAPALSLVHDSAEPMKVHGG